MQKFTSSCPSKATKNELPIPTFCTYDILRETVPNSAKFFSWFSFRLKKGSTLMILRPTWVFCDQNWQKYEGLALEKWENHVPENRIQSWPQGFDLIKIIEEFCSQKKQTSFVGSIPPSPLSEPLGLGGQNSGIRRFSQSLEKNSDIVHHDMTVADSFCDFGSAEFRGFFYTIMTFVAFYNSTPQLWFIFKMFFSVMMNEEIILHIFILNS